MLFVITAGVPLLLLVTVLGTAVLLVAGRGLRHLWLLAPTVFLGWPWLWAVVRGPGALLTMPGQTIATDSAPTYLLAVGFPAPIDMSWLSGLISDLGLGEVSAGILQLWAPILMLPMLILAFFTLIEARSTPPDLGCRPLPRRSHPRRDPSACLRNRTLPPHRLLPAAGLTWSASAILLLSSEPTAQPDAVGPSRTAGSTTASGAKERPRDPADCPCAALSGLVTVAAVGLIALGAGRADNGRRSPRPPSNIPTGRRPRRRGTQARTLRLDNVDGEVLATLVSSDDGTVLGTSTVTSAETVGGWPWQRRPLPITSDQVLVAQAASALSADDAGDISSILGELGVDFVLVGPDAGSLTNSVSVSEGLLPVGPTSSGQLWRVDKPYSGRFLIREAEGQVSTAAMHGTTAKVPAGQEGRVLTIADAADGITASIDGRPCRSRNPAKRHGRANSTSLPRRRRRDLTELTALPGRRHRRMGARTAQPHRGHSLRPGRNTAKTGRKGGESMKHQRSIVTFAAIAVPGVLVAMTSFLTR